MTTEVSRYTILREQLEASGPHIPILLGETIGAALLDTGARVSVIDMELARRMGFRESGTRTITGVTGTGVTGAAEFPAFHAEIHVPCLDLTLPSPIQGAPLRANGIPWHAVIGRDILLRLDHRLDGPTGKYRAKRRKERELYTEVTNRNQRAE